jgi:hypothetical protein
LAEATPVAASFPPTTNRIEERLLLLEAQELERQRVANPQQQLGEAQLEPERERVANLQQQQERPPAPSTTNGSAAKCSLSPQQKRWIALGIVVAAVVVVLAVVIATVVNSPEPPVPVEPVLPSSLAPDTAASPVSPTPPPPARVNSILRYINSITLSGQTLFYPPSTPGTAEERAVQWLIEDDVNTAKRINCLAPTLCVVHPVVHPNKTGGHG